ncbi:MAG TPA: LamG domain-containing protein, partial [Niastella sp.]|nr:LamG domain-containing protein [Niastella sp.]
KIKAMRKSLYAACMAMALLSCNKLEELCNPTPGKTTAGALDFDGQDDEVILGDWFRYQVFTIQFWAKPGATQNSYANIIDNEHDSYISWTIQQNGDETNNYYYGGGANAYFSLEAGVWQQVSLVKKEDSVGVYVNGILIDKAPRIIDIDYPYSHTMRLGNWAGGGRNWNGQLDEVRIWNRALSKAEIKSNMNCQLTGSETGLVAYYKFNQGAVNADNSAVNALTDASGNQHTGTLTNFALSGTTSNWVAGKVTGICY